MALQLIARGHSLGSLVQLRAQALGDLIAAVRDALDAPGADTVRDGVRERGAAD